MALRDFVLNLMEDLLHDEELGLREENLRFYDKGTTAETDEVLDDHIRWRNARYFNEDSNVVRNSLLIVQLPVGENAEYINFHVGELYRIYRKDGMERVLPMVKRDIKDIRASAAGSLSLLNQFRDYEAIREHLIIRPLNYDDNEKALAKAVYRRVGDIALVLYISLGKVGQGGASNILSAMVPRDTFQGWALDEQEVLDRALENTMRLQPPVLLDFGANPLRMKHIPFMDDESVRLDAGGPMGLNLSTEQEINGAIAAFYPGVLDRLSQMAGGDIYVLFTSISDLHVHPVNGRYTLSSMRRTLTDTNRDLNQHGELLTRQIYQYSRDTKEFTVI